MNPIQQHVALSAIGRRLSSLLGQASPNQQMIVHVIKTVIAACMAAGLAMQLELPQPRTAMTTVFVLMQPLSGMVLAKSFYRVLGTLFGTVAAIAIASVFPQTPEMYLASVAGWCSVCAGASVRYRHFRWYAWVLAGYTAILITVPTAAQPTDVYLAALTRAAEVTVGILCSALVSMVILPAMSGKALIADLRSRYDGLASLASDALGGKATAAEFDLRFSRMVEGMANLEAASAFAAFENPFIRVRAGRLARINEEFLHTCFRLHALFHLLRRPEKSSSKTLLATFDAQLKLLTEAIGVSRAFVSPTDIAPHRLASHIRLIRAHVLDIIARDRAALHRGAHVDDVIDFDTTCEVLCRFLTGFVRYAIVYESLRHDSHRLEQTSPRYHVAWDPYVATFAVFRTALAVGVTGWFWETTAWPSGADAMIGAAVASALSSISPTPAKFIQQMMFGTALSAIAGYIYLCYIYPSIDGFPLLCLALTPVFALGAWLSTAPATAGFGVGFSVFFCFLAGPDNMVSYTPDTLINNGIALVASMAVSAVIFAVVFPPEMSWSIRRMEQALRQQVCDAIRAPLPGLARRFQYTTHGFMSQIRQLHGGNPERGKASWKWMLACLEAGFTVIDLRNHMQLIHAPPNNAWQSAMAMVQFRLSRLFSEPRHPNVRLAADAVDQAIAMVKAEIGGLPDGGYASRLRRILCSLHFLGMVLQHNDSPLNSCSCVSRPTGGRTAAGER